MNDAELRRLTYSRGDICDRTINTTYLTQDIPLDQFSPHTPSSASLHRATASLGHFENLPLEIVENIFSHLTLSQLTLLRSISKRMTLTIDSLSAYRQIITHAPHALRALLSTLTARYFTASTLSTALRSPSCFLCGRLGAYLSLLTCQRICWTCLCTSPAILPISLACAKRIFQFSPLAHPTTPILLTLPGFYSLKKHNRPNQKEPPGGQRVQLVAYGAVPHLSDFSTYAGPAGETIYGAAKRHTAFALRDPRYGHAPELDVVTTDPVGYAAGYAQEPQRFMAAVRFPVLDAQGGEVEWGVSCMICLMGARDGDEERFWNEVYLRGEVGAHVEGCLAREQERRRKVYRRVRKVLERGRGYAKGKGKSVHGSAE